MPKSPEEIRKELARLESNRAVLLAKRDLLTKKLEPFLAGGQDVSTCRAALQKHQLGLETKMEELASKLEEIYERHENKVSSPDTSGGQQGTTSSLTPRSG